MSHLITYDLRAPGKDYAALFAAIQAMGTRYVHPLKSVWIVDSLKTSQEIATILWSKMDHNDLLIVTEYRNSCVSPTVYPLTHTF